MRTRVAIIGASLTALACCFALGRWSKRTQVVEKTRTVDVVREARTQQQQASTAQVVHVQGPERVRTVRYACPDGRVSEETVTERGPARIETRVADVKSTTSSATERIATVERLVVTPAPLPRWSVSALGGVSPRGSVWGGEVGVRVIGNWSAVALVTTERTALVGLEWRW